MNRLFSGITKFFVRLYILLKEMYAELFYFFTSITWKSFFIFLRDLDILLFFFAIGSFLYILFGPLQPASYKNLSINQSIVYAGEPLSYSLQYCRYVDSNVPVTIYIVLVPEKSQFSPVSLSSYQTTSGIGCSNIRKQVSVPYNTEQGIYRLRITGLYTILPIRSVSLSITSRSFYIHTGRLNTQVQDIQSEIQDLQDKLNNLTLLSNQVVQQNTGSQTALVNDQTPQQSSSSISTVQHSQAASVQQNSQSSSNSQGNGQRTNPPPQSPPKQTLVQKVVSTVTNIVHSIL